MFKKICSLAIVLVMMLSLASTAFAEFVYIEGFEENNKSAKQIELWGNYAIVVCGDGSAIDTLNVYDVTSKELVTTLGLPVYKTGKNYFAENIGVSGDWLFISWNRHIGSGDPSVRRYNLNDIVAGKLEHVEGKGIRDDKVSYVYKNKLYFTDPKTINISSINTESGSRDGFMALPSAEDTKNIKGLLIDDNYFYIYRQNEIRVYSAENIHAGINQTYSDTKVIYNSEKTIEDITLYDGKLYVSYEEGLEILGNQAFYWSKIQNITLPQSLKIIGGYAFGDASIKRIVIPDNVIDIGEGAFEGSSVETVVIGKSVGNIGASAFANCYDLKSITIPDSVYALEGNALGTRWLENIHLGKNLQSFSEKVFGYNYPYNIRSITVSAESEYLSVKDNVVFDKKGEKILFYPNCKEEEEYVIPDGVKIIGEECFDYNSNFTTLTIPKSVITIEKYNNPSKLVNVKYAGTREEWEKIDIQSGCDVIKDAIITFSDGSTKNLHENLRYCEKDGKAYIIGLWDKDAQSVTIPGEIDGKEVVIGSSAFKSSKLVTVTLDESIKKIPYCAFQNCESLQNINLENVEHIDGQAFMYCTSLKNVNLLNIKSWSGISEERLDEKRMQLELTPNPWLYTYNISSVYTIFYGAKIENLRIKWPEENFEEGAQTFPAFFLNAEIKNVYFENFTVSPSLAEFYGIDTSRYIRTSDPDVDLTYPNSEMTIFGSSEDVKGYAEAIGVNFKYID